jgi:integrase
MKVSSPMTSKLPHDPKPARLKRDAHAGTVTAKRRMGRTVWVARILLQDGSRKELTCPYGLNREQSEARAKEWQTKEDKGGGLYLAKMKRVGKPIGGETANAWHVRMLPVRAAHTGNSDHGHHTIRWGKWIAPIVGKSAIASLTRKDALAVRDHLDIAISAQLLSAKTAANVWSCFCVAMRVASSTKAWAKALNALESDITAGVEPPDGGSSKLRQWIYPNEFAQLLSCDAVPTERRRVYALAAYTGLRPGELCELRWKDVDGVAGVVRVSRALDRTAKKVKVPKTASGVREVPIEASLYPLLAGGKPEDLVAPELLAISEFELARTFRGDLRAAGIDAPRLWANTATHRMVDYRCLRDSYATWQCLAGLDIHKLMRRLGHSGLTMTLRYTKLAESLGTAVGAPFGSLPPSLRAMNAAETASVTRSVSRIAFHLENERPQGDSNPC